jgi:beta-lactam-binding protein with PASTA domain
VALISLLVIVLVIIAAVLITAPSTTKVTLRNVVYSDVHQASESLQKLVSENTK